MTARERVGVGLLLLGLVLAVVAALTTGITWTEAWGGMLLVGLAVVIIASVGKVGSGAKRNGSGVEQR